MVGSVEIALEPGPASASHARRALRHELEDIGAPEELIDTACLLVSEVVTNAVLHAGTPIDVRFEPRPTGVRVEVEDRSTVTPSSRKHEPGHMTGRGIALVEGLATRTGVDVVAGGKVVWFVVGDVKSDDAEAGDASPHETFTVRYVDAHVPMARTALAYGEAVVRELALLALDGDPDAEGVWKPPRFNLGPLLDALDEAADRGQDRATLTVEFPVEAKELALERLALVEDAHELARQGKLLTVAAIPEVMHCRRWIYRQIVQQADGKAPEPWVLPEDLDIATEVSLDTSDRAALDGDGALVAASDANRIVFVNELAEAVVGASAEELIGRRLTAVIPPEWRLAHLVGFARYQLTGESRIVGTTVTVPLLRADGTVIDVDLQIDAISVKGGRVFRAALSPSTSAASD